ncbi:thiamine pyrophosphate-binding protein, partial [Alphaproteobacteria bacterium]|nr:thiamine pyrophosphate-binding protein [Alphaproteobacteria bacterium]
AELTGSEILAKALRNEGVNDLFFIMGGPMLLAEESCIKEGIRPIDVRHEQAAAFMGQAYSRLLNKPSVCMAASGPGVTNLITGIANAYIDCVPVVAVGGSSPFKAYGRQVFQEIDQLGMMKPCTKWAERVYSLARIPEMVNVAFQKAMAGKPGPVYLDFPGDILYEKIDESEIDWSISGRSIPRARPHAAPELISGTVEALSKAKKPVIITGGGILWSDAADELREFVDKAEIPFYTTPQGRGVIPEDHPLSYMTVRSAAFREADLIMIIGTRMNYIIGHAAPPRFNTDATIIRIDVDEDEISTSPRKIDIGIVGDAKAVLHQINSRLDGVVNKDSFLEWRNRLSDEEASKRSGPGGNSVSDAVPIHPLRLCEEVKNFMDRDAILVVDGQEILNYGRQSMPTFEPGHRLNSGPFGTMGVGLPFGLGAKIAKPDCQVIVVHGDGSFGLNAMELDTAVRHGINVLVVISLNGGWTADPDGTKPGRDLGYTRYDKMAEALGCYAEYIEQPGEIKGALERAQEQVNKGRVAVVNIKTDHTARAGTQAFAQYST